MKKANHIIVLTTFLLILSCSEDLDLSGFIYSPDHSNERFEQSMAWNSLNPKKDIVVQSENYTFLAAGDAHVGSTANLDFFIGKALEPDVAFSLLAGDMTSGQKADYDTLFKHLDRLDPDPWLLTVGNHDLWFGGWDSFSNYFGSSTYTFKVTCQSGTDLFICVDTGSGTLGSKQFRWLKETLMSERGGYRNCILFTHVNFFREHQTLSTNPLVEELYALLDLFADYRINMVIMGHDHKRSVETLGATHYITLDGLEDGASNASYLKITNKKGTLGYEFIDVAR